VIPLGLLLQVAAPVVLVLAIGAGVYSAGRASVQRAWDTERAKQEAAAGRDSLRRMEANHGVGIDYRKQAHAAQAAAAAARADADGLREHLAARAADDSAAGPGADEAAATARAFGECVGSLAEVAATADRLSTQTAGLQGYVRQVCLSEAKP